jgi:hypothetical protein
MKTIQEIASADEYSGEKNQYLYKLLPFLTGRDYRLLNLKCPEDLERFLKERSRPPIPFTKENVLVYLREDVGYGFDKALRKSGVGAAYAFEIVSMWNWVLQEGLEGFDSYKNYGLPLFKATANKYGFMDHINGFTGSEDLFGDDTDDLESC